MEISLQIIFEKLKLKKDQALLKSPHQSRFTDVRLLGFKQTVLKKGILYVVEGSLERDLIYEDGCGLILLNGAGSFDCDVLFINGQYPFYDLFNEISQIFYEIRRLFENLNQAIIHKKGLQHVIEIISEICGNPVYLVDTSFKVLGISGPDFMEEISVSWRHLLRDGYLPYNIVMNLIESNELHNMETGLCANIVFSKYFYTPFINYNMRYKDKLQGHFFVVGMLKEITPGDLELTNLAGPYVADAIRYNSDFQLTRGRYYAHFIIDMLEGKSMGIDHIKNQLKSLHLEMNDFYTVIIIKPHRYDELRNEQIALQLESISSCKPVDYQDSVVAIFPKNKRNQKSLLKKLTNLSKSIDGVIGISYEMNGFDKIHSLFVQATAAITLGETLQLPNKILHYHDIMRFHPFLAFDRKDLLESMCHPGVLMINEYDQKNKTKFIATLEVYLKNERHSLPTAADLHIHRNTLTYRLEKINTLYDFDLDNTVEREQIRMTLNILEFCEKKNWPVEDTAEGL